MVKTDKCMGVSRFWGLAPGLPPKSTPMRPTGNCCRPRPIKKRKHIVNNRCLHFSVVTIGLRSFLSFNKLVVYDP